jgi:hypothetical protein
MENVRNEKKVLGTRRFALSAGSQSNLYSQVIMLLIVRLYKSRIERPFLQLLKYM